MVGEVVEEDEEEEREKGAVVVVVEMSSWQNRHRHEQERGRFPWWRRTTTTRLRLAGGQIMCLSTVAAVLAEQVVVCFAVPVSCFWARAAPSPHAIGGGPLVGMQVGK